MIESISDLGLEIIIITTPDQFEKLPLLPKIVTVFSTDKIDSQNVYEYMRKLELTHDNFVAISFGARWIFSKKVIEKLFLNKLINIHGTRLPLDKGGGGFSWRIMRGDRLGMILLHLIDEGIDTGPILYHDEYVIPRDCQLPWDIERDFQKRLLSCLVKFISKITIKKTQLELIKQIDFIGTYNPRLYSEMHGWINWMWSPSELSMFINAFDSPYPGAKCLLNNQVVHLRSAQLHAADMRCHSFQVGIVARKAKTWIIVLLRDGWSLIIEEVISKDGLNIISAINEGDRFYTPGQYLEQALSNRARYTPKGVIAGKAKVTD